VIRYRIGFWVGMAALVVANHPCRCGGQVVGAPTLEQIKAVWQARERRVRTLDVSWRGPRVQTKEWAMISAGRGDLTPTAKGTLKFDSEYRFVIDERGRIRFEEKGKAFMQDRDEPVDRHLIRTIRDNEQHTFFSYGSARYPTCFIVRSKADKDSRLLPIAAIYRPFHAMVGFFDGNQLQLAGRTVVQDGRTCVVLKHQEHEIWVDPARDFVPVRIMEVHEGAIRVDVVVTYRLADKEWAPDAWNTVFTSRRGKVIDDSFAAKLTDFRLNEAIGDETFEIEYPLGTWMNNRITDESYILREGGNKRPVVPGEFTGRNYEQLRDSDPPGSGSRSGAWMALLAALVLALTAALVIIVRRRRRLLGQPK
jgi:hypothetical protein